MSKSFKELFAPTWNGIAVRVWCVLYASRSRRHVERLVAMHTRKIKHWWTNKSEERDSVSEVKHRHGNSVASLSVHAQTSQLYIL